MTPSHFPYTPQHHDSAHPDPLMSKQAFPYRRTFYPLGLPVEIETNAEQILEAAAESWGEYGMLPTGGMAQEPLKLRLGVSPTTASIVCPPAPGIRANGHLLSIIANPENFAVCDLRQGIAFGWVDVACLAHRSYLRYHFLETIVLCLLSGSRVTPIHGACINLAGFGFLLCGASGAGKSTLAYGCARAGWTFTSDDASYLLWNQGRPTVRGNAHQARFRPSARDLFPELQHRSITPRAEGKPSIEIRTAELPGIRVHPESPVHAIVFLHRREADEDEDLVQLDPLTRNDVQPYLEQSLFDLDEIHQQQAAALDGLLELDMYALHYRSLPGAITRLEHLAQSTQKTNPDKGMTTPGHHPDTDCASSGHTES